LYGNLTIPYSACPTDDLHTRANDWLGPDGRGWEIIVIVGAPLAARGGAGIPEPLAPRSLRRAPGRALSSPPAAYRGNNVTSTSGNRVVSDLPGGETAARQMFDRLTGGSHVVQPSGQLLGPNGHRLRLASDGRWRVEIPAHDGLLHETIHFNN